MKRSYMIAPPEFHGNKRVAFDRYAGKFKETEEDQSFLQANLPDFLKKRKPNNILRYINELAVWARDEYYAAREFYFVARNRERIAWIRKLNPSHVLARFVGIEEVFSKFTADPVLWEALDNDVQAFYIQVWHTYQADRAYEKALNPTPPRRRVLHQPSREDVKLERYDEALLALVDYNSQNPGPINPETLRQIRMNEEFNGLQPT